MTNIDKALARLREDRRNAQRQTQQLTEAISVLEKLTRGKGGAANGGRAKRVLSPAGRRRISLAQKARWAKLRQVRKAA